VARHRHQTRDRRVRAGGERKRLAGVRPAGGADRRVRQRRHGLSKISVGVEVEAYADQVTAFFEDARHPTLERPYVSCGYVPMIELLRYLEANGFLRFIAAGNSNGDLEMLSFAGGEGKPALRLVVRHDDAEREVADTTGAEHVLDAGFTEISMRDDWATVFKL
jgi:hypothetical protein